MLRCSSAVLTHDGGEDDGVVLGSGDHGQRSGGSSPSSFSFLSSSLAWRGSWVATEWWQAMGEALGHRVSFYSHPQLW